LKPSSFLRLRIKIPCEHRGYTGTAKQYPQAPELVNGGKSSLSEQNHLLSPAMIEKKKKTLSPKTMMRCNTFFFHIHLMEAENWSPFTVSHRCSTSTRKKHRGRQAMPQLYPHPTCIHTPYQNLCTQLCSTNEAKYIPLGNPYTRPKWKCE